MSKSALSALMQCHRLGGLNNRNLFLISHLSGGWEFQSEGVVCSVPSYNSSHLGSQMASLSLCPHICPFCVCREKEKDFSPFFL
jgi:hypothetical protein